MNLYLILEKLSNEGEEHLLVHNKEELMKAIDDNKDIIFSRYIPDTVEELSSILSDNDKVYIINLDGEVMEIVDYTTNYPNILKYLDDIKSLARDSVKDHLDDYRDKGNELIHLEFDKYPVECIRGSVIKSTYYDICDEVIDNKSESLTDVIAEEVKKEREEVENSKPMKTELDVVNFVIEKYLGKLADGLEIEQCTYNGIAISPNDLITKLHSHTMPEYLEQIDIRTTLEDTYTIKTNIGDIYREPHTGRITVYAKEDKKEEVK